MTNKNNSFYGSTPRSLLIFYVLVVYVFLQFCWWSYLLFDLNSEILILKEELLKYQGTETELPALNLKEKIAQKRLMIFGEGLVFLLLLGLGMLQTRRSFRRETRVANLQKNFLLSVTHELKSPIASVKLYLQTISKRELPREKQIELLTKAIDESNRLDHLVENILLAARIDNHKFQLVLEEVNLEEFVNTFLDSFETKAHIKIERKINSSGIVMADTQALHSIFTNLLENAVKYSESAPEIEVEITDLGDFTKVEVRDQGIGISELDKPLIFDKFYRSGNEETRRTKGTGLGLFIVNYLAELHQASIRALENTPKGTNFDIRFKNIHS